MRIYSAFLTNIVIAATLAYCWAIWWFSGLFSLLVPAIHGTHQTSMPAVALVAPLADGFWTQALHWQLAAIASLVAALLVRRKLSNEKIMDHSPFVAHGFYLLAISFLHVVGMLASLVDFAYSLD